MTHVALRRVMIRLVHDAVFAASLQADAERALAGVDLSGQEREWLCATPPAAWRTDPARPVRVLAALAEEFPVTVGLAPAHAADFFRSPEFHAAIQGRGSLAGAFGEYLGRAPDARACSLALLEGAVAGVRRAASRPVRSSTDRLRLAPHALIVRVPNGALELLHARRAGGTGAALGLDEEAVLVAGTPGGGDVTLEVLEPALAALLVRAARGCTRAEWLAEARCHGAEPGEDAEILAALLGDGLLVVGEESAPV